jgi:hypothetical protein
MDAQPFADGGIRMHFPSSAVVTARMRFFNLG